MGDFEKVTQTCNHAFTHNQVKLQLQIWTKNKKSSDAFLNFFLPWHFNGFFSSSQIGAKLTEELMKKEFESLYQFLREEEAFRVLALREKYKEKKREAEERVDKMNQVIKRLEERIQLIEEELDAGGDGVAFLEVTSIKSCIVRQWSVCI